MNYKGTVRGNIIELDEPAVLPEGTRVQVMIVFEEEPAKGSPQAILQLAGTLTHEEAALIRQAVDEIRRIDASLWEVQGPCDT